MFQTRPRRPYHSLTSSEQVPRLPENENAVELRSLSASDPRPLLKHISHEFENVPAPRWWSGWRVGTSFAALAVGASLVVNCAVLGWLSKHATLRDGLVQLYSGDCGRTENMNTWVHLGINALSTVMLASSNYTMQVLVGPTREEINKAHSRGKWLDIGVPSLRNLSSIARVRRILWFALGLSSLPLHLMFNSTFYPAIATYDYNLLITTESFLKGANFTVSDNAKYSQAFYESLQQRAGTFYFMTKAACINAYAGETVTDRGDVIVISTYQSSNNSLLFTGYYSFTDTVVSSYDPFSWICAKGAGEEDGVSCSTNVTWWSQNPSQWSPEGYKAESCLSEKLPSQCTLNANIPFMVVVIVSNSVKLLAMLYVALFLDSKPLLVVGDAIASFLQCPDESTMHMCLLSRERTKPSAAGAQLWPAIDSFLSTKPSAPPQTAKDLKDRANWYSAPSSRRWVLFFAITVTCNLGIVLFFVMSLGKTSSSVSMIDLGFGKITGRTLISGLGWIPSAMHSVSPQVLSSTLTANTPQLVLSLVYYNFNGILTAMFLANEWSNFAVHRKTLRVSHPQGDQRGTYFLQLPYRIAVPNMVLFTLLHWLLSRSLFLAVIFEWDTTNTLTPTRIATCGYSPLPILLVMVLGLLLPIMAILLASKIYNPIIPLAGSCSAAIAAACHVPHWEHDITMKPLQWGAIENLEIETDEPLDGVPIGHCCFSSGEVKTPEIGKPYA